MTTGAEAIAILEKISIPSLILLNPELHVMGPQEFVNFLRRMPGFEKVAIAQIGSEKRLDGTFSQVDVSDLDPILKWLDSGK